MANTPNPAAGAPVFSPEDLKDPTLFKVNSNFTLLWGKIATLYQSGSTANLGATIQAPVIQATGQSTPPPAGSNVLLTRASADALYGPKTQRTALVNATYEGNSVQPAPPSSSGTQHYLGVEYNNNPVLY